MRSKPGLWLLLTPLVLIIEFVGAEDENKPDDTPKKQEIMASIDRITGLSGAFPIESVEKVSFAELKVPFLRNGRAKDSGLRVTIGPGNLKLKSAAKSSHDFYQRRFVLTLSADARQLLSITSSFQGTPKQDIVPDPSVDSIERQFSARGESYRSFPEEAPRTTFLDALDEILSNGISSPLRAKEIDGYYVMYSYKDRGPHAVWVIMMRGANPARPIGDGRDWERARIRNLVDATTGKWLGADSLPLPVE